MANGPTLTSTGSILGNGMALRGIGRRLRFGVMQAGRAGEVKLECHYGGTRPDYEFANHGGADLALRFGHSNATAARSTPAGKRARCSGSARVNSSRARKAGGLSTMRTPLSARESGEKTGCSSA